VEWGKFARRPRSLNVTRVRDAEKGQACFKKNTFFSLPVTDSSGQNSQQDWHT